MNLIIPNWLIILSGAGQIFTALIYPYIRHRVFDWYNGVKQLKPLNQEIAKVLGRPEVKERFLGIGTMVVASSPEALTAAMKKEMETSGKLIQKLGIRGD